MSIAASAALLSDVQVAIRSLRRSPGFVLISVVTLGLGIGANTSAFSVLNGVVLKPTPYADNDRLQRVYRATARNPRGSVSPADFLDLESELTGKGEVAAYAETEMALSAPGEPPFMAAGLRVSSNVFATLGVPPELGRDFRADEEVRGNHRVLIISRRCWLNRFAGDPGILGRIVRVDLPG